MNELTTLTPYNTGVVIMLIGVCIHSGAAILKAFQRAWLDQQSTVACPTFAVKIAKIEQPLQPEKRMMFKDLPWYAVFVNSGMEYRKLSRCVNYLGECGHKYKANCVETRSGILEFYDPKGLVTYKVVRTQ